MAATFPGGVKSFTTKQAEDDIMASHVNDLQDEVAAIETELLVPSQFLKTPESAPTSDYQVANKKYVDEKSTVVFLTASLTSPDWDGDSYSTTAKTKINLNDKFGTPTGIKAILAQVSIRDSGSAGTTCRFVLGANNIAYNGATVLTLPINDQWNESQVIAPCDEDGNVYYQIIASGAGTFEVYFSIVGYWL